MISTGPDLRLRELLGEAGIGDMALGYGTPAGNERLRQVIADQHGVGPEDVVITVGGMHALFLLAFILCERGDEAVTTEPLFPLARNALEAVGAKVSALRSPSTAAIGPISPSFARGSRRRPGW
jgi:DNA-binding transcriptional MocR family regulator